MIELIWLIKKNGGFNMKFYVIIKEGGCYTDYYSEIVLVTSKKREAFKIANEINDNIKPIDYVNALYIDVWENGKQTETIKIK